MALPPRPRFRIVLAALLAFSLPTLLLATSSEAGRRRSGTGHENAGHLTFTSPQSNPIALSPDGDFLYVANTTSNTLELSTRRSTGRSSRSTWASSR
jgi:sugar lactone lactonase YvrE